MNLKKIYNSSPPFIQNIGKRVYPYFKKPIWKNPEFLKWYNFLQESQWWSKEKLEKYQIQQLSKLLNHAYESVPYYRRVFDKRSLKPKDIKNFDDLKKLPYLTKDDVRKNLKDLIARNILKEDMKYVTTGGTSGEPLGFYIERKTNIIRMAFEWREWNWMGYKFGDRCIVLRGNVVKRKENGKPSWWEYDKENNYLILSTYDMTDENLPKYIKKIEAFKPRIIRAYPSAIDILAKFIKENNLKINTNGNIKAISTSSENLYPTQRELIEEVFKCPIFDKYGNCEQVAILGECEKHEGYHDFMEYSYTEILDKEGKPITREGETGEIVSTGFTNYAVPFIRYKTEDLIKYNTRNCSCGREYPLIKSIEGRLQGFIVANDGSLIALGPAIFGIHDIEWTRVKQIQFLQETPGELIIQVAKNPSYSDTEIETYVLRLFRARLKRRCKLQVRFVGYIPYTRRGKFNYLIQKIDIEKFR